MSSPETNTAPQSNEPFRRPRTNNPHERSAIFPSPQGNPSAAQGNPPADNPRRKKALTALASVVVLAGLALGTYWALVPNHYESTDNAYVQGNVIQITPQIGGTVIAIMADDTDFVKAGQPLVKLDPADARVALDQAEARLAQAVRQVRTLYANNGALAAQIALRDADGAQGASDVARAQDDDVRRRAASRSPAGAVGKERAQPCANATRRREERALAGAQAAVLAAREQLASNQALTEGTSIEQHPSVHGAAAKRARGLSRPATRRAAGAGLGLCGQAHRAAGPACRRRHPADVHHPAQSGLGRCQLQGSAVAQHPHRPAGHADGRPVRQKGGIQRHGRRPGRGHRRAFALLPAQNATGNWIKVVQRVPVRIALDPQELAAHPLRVGLSMDAKVDVSKRRQDAGRCAARLGARPQTNAMLRPGQRAADAEVRRDHRRQRRPHARPRRASRAASRSRKAAATVAQAAKGAPWRTVFAATKYPPITALFSWLPPPAAPRPSCAGTRGHRPPPSRSPAARRRWSRHDRAVRSRRS